MREVNRTPCSALLLGVRFVPRKLPTLVFGVLLEGTVREAKIGDAVSISIAEKTLSRDMGSQRGETEEAAASSGPSSVVSDEETKRGAALGDEESADLAEDRSSQEPTREASEASSEAGR